MKKNVIFAFVAVVLAVVCLAGCVDDNGKTFDKLNGAMRASYSHVSVTVKTEHNGVKLGGIFEVSFDGETATVDYSYEKLREISADGNNPEEYTEKVTGSATVVNGLFTNGMENADLNAGELAYTGFSFKKGYLSDIEVSDLFFSAMVVNPKGFVGNSKFEGSDMTVQAAFGGDKLTELIVEFVSAEGAAVSVVYDFDA